MSAYLLIACSVLADPIALDFSWPISPYAKYRKDQEMFGYLEEKNKYHFGEDWNRIYNPDIGETGDIDLGDPVYCIGNGRVVRARNIEEMDPWGKVVVVAHTLPDYRIFYSVYAHLERIDVDVGDEPKKGEQIGTIGNANGYYTRERNGSSAHLHLAIMKRGPFPPSVTAYEDKLEVKKAADYCVPTLFIESRLEWMKEKHRLTTSWRDIMPSRMAPTSTAYVEYGGLTLSLSEAVENGFVKLRYKIGSQWYVVATATAANELAWLYFHYDFKVQVRVKALLGALYIFPLDWGEAMAKLQARQDLVLAAGVLNDSGQYQIKSLGLAEMDFGPYADEGYEGFLSTLAVMSKGGLPNHMTHFRHNREVLWRVLTYSYDDMHLGSMQLSPNYLY